MTSIPRKVLVKAAKELNEVLGLDPEINVRGGVEDLMSDIVEAAGLIMPDDNISKGTMEVIEQVRKVLNQGKDQASPNKEPIKETQKKVEVKKEKLTEVEKTRKKSSKPKEVPKWVKVVEAVIEHPGSTTKEIMKLLADEGIETSYTFVSDIVRVVNYTVEKIGGK